MEGVYDRGRERGRQRDTGVQHSGGGKFVKLQICTFQKIKSYHPDLTVLTATSLPKCIFFSLWFLFSSVFFLIPTHIRTYTCFQCDDLSLHLQSVIEESCLALQTNNCHRDGEGIMLDSRLALCVSMHWCVCVWFHMNTCVTVSRASFSVCTSILFLKKFTDVLLSVMEVICRKRASLVLWYYDTFAWRILTVSWFLQPFSFPAFGPLE